MPENWWTNATRAVRSFALAPLPSLSLWVSDYVSKLALDLFSHAVTWREARRVHPSRRGLARVDLLLLVLLIGWAVWGAARCSFFGSDAEVAQRRNAASGTAQAVASQELTISRMVPARLPVLTDYAQGGSAHV